MSTILSALTQHIDAMPPVLVACFDSQQEVISTVQELRAQGLMFSTEYACISDARLGQDKKFKVLYDKYKLEDTSTHEPLMFHIPNDYSSYFYNMRFKVARDVWQYVVNMHELSLTQEFNEEIALQHQSIMSDSSLQIVARFKDNSLCLELWINTLHNMNTFLLHIMNIMHLVQNRDLAILLVNGMLDALFSPKLRFSTCLTEYSNQNSDLSVINKGYLDLCSKAYELAISKLNSRPICLRHNDLYRQIIYNKEDCEVYVPVIDDILLKTVPQEPIVVTAQASIALEFYSI